MKNKKPKRKVRNRTPNQILYDAIAKLQLTQSQAAKMLGLSMGSIVPILRLGRIPCFARKSNDGLKQRFEELTDYPITLLFPGMPYTREQSEKPETIEYLFNTSFPTLSSAYAELVSLPLTPYEEMVLKEEEEIEAEAFEILEAVISSLTPREGTVIRKRFYEQMILEEIGKEFHCDRERIRQIEAKALRKLRHPTRLRRLQEIHFEFNSGIN